MSEQNLAKNVMISGYDFFFSVVNKKTKLRNINRVTSCKILHLFFINRILYILITNTNN